MKTKPTKIEGMRSYSEGRDDWGVVFGEAVLPLADFLPDTREDLVAAGVPEAVIKAFETPEEDEDEDWEISYDAFASWVQDQM